MGGGEFLSDIDADNFRHRINELQAEEAQRKKQQGLGRPIIAHEFQGQRVVAVCNRVYHSPNWKTFHDFLREYIFIVLGRQWVEEQRKKPSTERHQIMAWFEQATSDARAMGVDENGHYSGAMTGAQRAFLNLSYNLYLVAHHSEPEKSETILDSFVWRLKSARTDDFIGKLFETYASAAFLKAGFQIEYENERDGRDSHVEFIATYPETGRKFAVEVKTRNRLIGADGPMDDTQRLRVGQKLAKALRKSTDHERIVFVEVNLPDVVGQDYTGTWVEAALEQIKAAEAFVDSEGQPYPPAYVIVTNHAYHNNLEAADIGLQAVADGYRIDDFGPGTQVSRFKEYLENLQRHREILALFDSLKEHSHVPITFDGEIPEFAFGEENDYPRLRIGREYHVPDDSGTEVLAFLEQAVVIETDAKAMCIYRLQDGRRILALNEMTDQELSAWRQYPETFFGNLEEKRATPNNWLELSEFFYRAYKQTSKDRLLDFMADHEDATRLAGLGQEELAILYCERTAWSAWNEMHKP